MIIGASRVPDATRPTAAGLVGYREDVARGGDLSPEPSLEGLDPRAAGVAMTLDDASRPSLPSYSHRCVWSTPARGPTFGAPPRRMRSIACWSCRATAAGTRS